MTTPGVPLKLATFNVKDLIDEAFRVAPERAREAADAKEAKLSAIADEVIRADPDVLGFQEVGSEALVRQVVARVAARTGSAYFTVMGTVDARGIGCALVSRIPLVRSEVYRTEALPFPVFDPADPPPFGQRLPLRRGVVHATVHTSLGDVDVLVAHLKSQRGVRGRDPDGSPRRPTTGVEHAEGLLRALVWRSGEALFIRQIIDALFVRDPQARIAVLGDFNDDLASVPLRILKGQLESALDGVETLVPEDRRFTTLHGSGEHAQGRGHIDHILLSSALRARAVAAEIQNEALRRHVFPQDGELPSADSDHALYAVTLR